jgi:hypothetical protein
MAKIKCDMQGCKYENYAEKMYFCPKCKLWLCREHSKGKCPSCGSAIPKTQ